MDDPAAMIQTFKENLDTFRYPQTVVCDTVNTSLSDLNDWRKRDIIPNVGYEKKGRVHYTGATLLRAGILAQLAPIFGPSAASEYADTFLMRRPVRFEDFDRKVAIINPHTPKFTDDPGPEWRDLTPIHLAEDTGDLSRIGGAVVVFPIGHLLPQWMLGAELRMDTAAAD